MTDRCEHERSHREAREHRARAARQNYLRRRRKNALVALITSDIKQGRLYVPRATGKHAAREWSRMYLGEWRDP